MTVTEQNKFLMWSPEYGETEDDAIKGTAAEWEGPQEMAARWAEWHDIYSAEYDIVGKSKTVAVKVKDCASGCTTEWHVTGEAVPSYSARAMTANAVADSRPE